MNVLKRDLSRFSQYPLREHASLEVFLEADPAPGVSTIRYGDGVLDLLFLDRGASTTIVVFHAAVSENVESFPVFNALGVTAKLHVNVLCVSDPTLARGVRLGWFAGNDGQPLQSDLRSIVSHYRDASSGSQHLVFFGASGGGFAAILYATQFPGSLAIALNPQTDVAQFYPAMVRAYANAAWGTDDIAKVDATTALAEINLDASGATVAYVQNTQDAPHMRHHLAPWLATLETRSRVWTLLRPWGDGHRPPPADTTRALLEQVSNADGEWSAALASFGFTPAPRSIELLE